jgi:sporulation protein YlmC with PRC-barrel domain
MRKYLITTVSTAALLFGAATMATAQDRSAPGAQDPAATSPGAGAIQKEGTQNDPAMQQRRSTSPSSDTSGSASSSGSVESSIYKSYSENKDSLAGATIAGGFTADQLIGADVQNASGDSVGEIEDLVVDTNNQVSKAIVGVGGFLGMGTRNVAVDLSELKQGTDQKGFTTSMTKEELKTLPEFKKQAGSWVRADASGAGGSSGSGGMGGSSSPGGMGGSSSPGGGTGTTR